MSLQSSEAFGCFLDAMYEAVLRDSEIDETVLHKLTEDHLRELGFPLGARLKLLNGIATLGSTNPAAPTPVKPPPTPSAPLGGWATTEAPEAVGERRHVTVVFCDLVDSTGIAARLDAEEWRDLWPVGRPCRSWPRATRGASST